MKRIFLIGYMGSGKTTIGQLVADRIGYSFIDMDAHIEEKQSKDITKIFVEIGEPGFRILEQQSLHEVAERENVIISTGGGTPCFFDNMEYMNAHGLTIYLRFTAAELVERFTAKNPNKRPLLKNKIGPNLLQFITDGLIEREPFYSQAAYTIEGNIESTVIGICELVLGK